jgi:hypothetical protein
MGREGVAPEIGVVGHCAGWQDRSFVKHSVGALPQLGQSTGL